MTGWERFFDDHAPHYDENGFTRDTIREVDFLIETLGLPRGATILDVGCGTGRHCVELARRGFGMTGIDISDGMLTEARKRASEAGVDVVWIQADAGRFVASQPMDAVICLCEGAFGLLGSKDDPIEQPLSILRNAAASLKRGAPCVFTVLNGIATARRFSDAQAADGAFDPLTMSERSECVDPEDPQAPPLRERGFVPTELRLLFSTAGLEVQAMWGGTAGRWGRRRIELDEMEIMVVARRSRSDRRETE